MISAYYSHIIPVDERTVVALPYCESMSFPDGEELTADVLKDDLHLNVVTSSGKEYSISIAFVQKFDSRYKDIDKKRVRELIYRRWIFLLEKAF